MTTVFVAAILITIAVPSFKHITVSSRLTTTANGLVSALHAARMEAIKRNANTLFCGKADNGDDTLGQACGPDDAGAVYTLVTTAANASSAAQQVQAAPVLSAQSLHLSTVNPLQFGANGLAHLVGQSQPYTGTVAVVCSNAIGSNNIRTISMNTGASLNTTPSSGACQ